MRRAGAHIYIDQTSAPRGRGELSAGKSPLVIRAASGGIAREIARGRRAIRERRGLSIAREMTLTGDKNMGADR